MNEKRSSWKIAKSRKSQDSAAYAEISWNYPFSFQSDAEKYERKSSDPQFSRETKENQEFSSFFRQTVKLANIKNTVWSEFLREIDGRKKTALESFAESDIFCEVGENEVKSSWRLRLC